MAQELQLCVDMRQTAFRLCAGLSTGLLLCSGPLPVEAQTQSTATSKTMSKEQIEQAVAPIALYPDELVSQILMASTYPLEIVEADRWVKKNAKLKGDALAKELEKQSWDPSVKSLVNFPDVLSAMSEKLEATTQLGNAFLEQQKEVLEAVQRLRGKAKAEGNLETTKEQKVIVEEGATTQTTIIKIEPSNPEVVYVPSYNPAVVYGAWPYPAYPPYSYYPYGAYYGGAVAAGALAFGAGMALGAAWGYAWGGANWNNNSVNVNSNRNVNRNTNINRSNYSNRSTQRNQAGSRGGSGQWQHDSSHRRGVSYRDNATSQRYNRGGNTQASANREAFRGRAASDRQQLGAGGNRSASQYQGQGRAQSGAQGQRSGSGAQRSASNAQRGSGGGAQRGGGSSSSAFRGMGGGGGSARQASSRGSMSRGSMGGARASRGGGGRR